MGKGLPQRVAAEHDFTQPYPQLEAFCSPGLNIAESVPKSPLRTSTSPPLFVRDTISRRNQLLWHFSGHGCFVFHARRWKRGESTNWSLFHFVRTKLDSKSQGTAWLINSSIQSTFKTRWDIFRTRLAIYRVATLSVRSKLKMYRRKAAG